MNVTAIAIQIVCNGWHLAGIRQQLLAMEAASA